MLEYLRFIVPLTTGWIDKDQQKIIDYLIEEIRVFIAGLPDNRSVENRARVDRLLLSGIKLSPKKTRCQVS